MKKIFVFAAAVCIAMSASAQEASQFSIGPRLGVNFSSATNITNSATLVGVAFGATSTYSFSEHSGISVDLLYSGEGFAEKNGDGKAKLGYVSIPIVYDYFIGELGEELRPKAYLGFAPAFLVTAKDQDGDDQKDFFNGINFSFVAGIGANYRLSDQVWLNGDLRAFIGLTDIRDKDLQDDINVNSRNVQLSVGVAFGLSKL